MTPSRIARVLALVLLLSPVLYAAEDITGKWGGTFVVNHDGQKENSTAHMVAKQAGADLTGTIGPSEDQQWPILKGKIATTKVDGKDVTKITFDVEVPNQSGTTLAHFALALTDGHLKGTAKAQENGAPIDAVLDLERIK